MKLSESSTFITLVNEVADKAPVNSPSFTGTPTGPTAEVGDSSPQLATTAYVQNELGTISNFDILDGGAF